MSAFPWKYYDPSTGKVFNITRCEVCGTTCEDINSVHIALQDANRLRSQGVLIACPVPAETIYYSERHDASACESCCRTDQKEVTE